MTSLENTAVNTAAQHYEDARSHLRIARLCWEPGDAGWEYQLGIAQRPADNIACLLRQQVVNGVEDRSDGGQPRKFSVRHLWATWLSATGDGASSASWPFSPSGASPSSSSLTSSSMLSRWSM